MMAAPGEARGEVASTEPWFETAMKWWWLS
jgi:hypothetical protein